MAVSSTRCEASGSNLSHPSYPLSDLFVVHRDNPFYHGCARRSVDNIHHCVDAIGGNAAIENTSSMPRLLRDSVIFENWEGTHNTLHPHPLHIVAGAVTRGLLEAPGKVAGTHADIRRDRFQYYRTTVVALKPLLGRQNLAVTVVLLPIKTHVTYGVVAIEPHQEFMADLARNPGTEKHLDNRHGQVTTRRDTVGTIQVAGVGNPPLRSQQHIGIALLKLIRHCVQSPPSTTP